MAEEVARRERKLVTVVFVDVVGSRRVPRRSIPKTSGICAVIGTLPDDADARLRAGSREQLERQLAFYRAVGATRYVLEGEALLAASA